MNDTSGEYSDNVLNVFCVLYSYPERSFHVCIHYNLQIPMPHKFPYEDML